VHLHFHGVSAEDVAATLAGRTLPDAALAARAVAVRIGSGWNNVPDRPALAGAARY